MKMSRRRFLTMCGALGAPGILAAAPRLFGRIGDPNRLIDPIPGMKGVVMPDELSKQMFRSHLHSVFQAIDPDQNPLTMKLIEVSDGPDNPRYDQFSILFQAPADSLNQQGTYRFEHPGIGTFTIFIVPVALDRDGLYYEAVFSHPKQQG